MNKHIVLDTQEILTCDACEEPIAISADKVIYGVGSVNYLKVYHRECEPLTAEALPFSKTKIAAGAIQTLSSNSLKTKKTNENTKSISNHSHAREYRRALNQMQIKPSQDQAPRPDLGAGHS